MTVALRTRSTARVGILALACAKQTVATAVDERSAEGGEAGGERGECFSSVALCQLETFVNVNTPLGWISFNCVGLPLSTTKRALNPLRPFKLNVVP